MTTPNQPASVEQRHRECAAKEHGYASWDDVRYWANGAAEREVANTAAILARFERDILAAQSNLHETQVGGREVEWLQARIAELIADGDGDWSACSGCQESVDGCVSAKDYPYSQIFKCQPGSGCRECGGIGVIWRDRGYYQMYEDAARDEALATPSDAGIAQQSGGGE